LVLIQAITTTTDSGGNYEFNVPQGLTYMVSVVSPGGNPTQDPDGIGDNSAQVFIAEGQSVTENDFGYSNINNSFNVSWRYFGGGCGAG